MGKITEGLITSIKQVLAEMSFDWTRPEDLDYEVCMERITTAVTGRVSSTALGQTQDVEQVIKEVLAVTGWYGPLQAYFDNDEVTEIMINTPFAPFLVEHQGQIRQARYAISGDWMHYLVEMFRRKRGLNGQPPPRYTGALSDPPLRFTWVSEIFGVNGASLYIRKFRRQPFSFKDQVRLGTITVELGRFLEAIIKARVNILVSGGSGAGKTTLLTTMGLAIPKMERIVAVEDEHEIHLAATHPNFVAYELNPELKDTTLSDLLRHVGLKVAPERVLVGEVRGKEAFDLMQAMNTGVEGSMATIHANSPQDALTKLADYVTMANMRMPLETIYRRIAAVKPVVVQITRLPGGKRVVSGLAECRSASRTEFETAALFKFQAGQIVSTGNPPSDYLAGKMAEAAVKLN